MKKLHRYLLVELLGNGLLTLTVVLLVFVLIALALVVGSSRAEGVPIEIVLIHTAYNAIGALFLTVPLTVLTACLFTYGRFRADGEYTAARIAGIHSWHVLAPAVLAGAAASLALAWLQDDLMPSANLRARRELTLDLVENLDGILKRSTDLVEGRWRARWGGRGQADDGSLLLYDLELFELDKEGAVSAHTFAKVARPVLDTANEILSLELSDFQRSEEKSARRTMVRTLTLQLQLDALSSASAASRRLRDRNYEELLLRAERKRADAAAATDAKHRRILLEDANETSAAYHFRVAFVFSPLLFGLFGAALGLSRGLGDRVVVFVVGFLIVVGVYYPLAMLGNALAESATLPAPVALWSGNAVLLATSIVLSRRLFRA